MRPSRLPLAPRRALLALALWRTKERQCLKQRFALPVRKSERIIAPARGLGNARDLLRFHSSLRVGPNRAHLSVSKTEHAKSLEYCCVDLLANDHCHRLRTQTAALFNVPADFA